ncbi:hypothetical protein V500_10627 [Pseudogymnoascus sp. VKM F-4518 (FW-2643)]|nr:hypothetical protein V500_10627 [Pseudogymnoascus sp. VKM F-4518 (FW-2643)]
MGNHQIQNGEAPANMSELEPRMSLKDGMRNAPSSPIFPAGSLVEDAEDAAASLPDNSSPRTITGLVARATSSSSPQLRSDSDENEEDTDEEYSGEEDSDKEDTTLDKEKSSAVEGGNLDATIPSEMNSLNPTKQPQETKADWKVNMELLDRETRFLFLIHFRHDVPDLKEEIIAKIIPGLACYSRTHINMRATIMKKCRQLRYKTVQSLVSHVKTAIHNAPPEQRSFLQGSAGMKELVEHFRTLYSPSNFFSAFPFIEHYIDIPKSFDLGKFYLEAIYTNFCARAKLHLDWASDPHRTLNSPHTRAGLVGFMEQFAMLAKFDHVTRDEFHELRGKRMNTRPDKPVEALRSLVRGIDFVSSQEAPPPSNRQLLGDGSGSVRG